MARIRVAFWLDDDRTSDVEILTYIKYLKQNRRFVTTLRRALRLVGTLDVSNTEELLKQYPWIVDVLKCDDENEIEQRLKELKELIMNTPQIPSAPLVAAPQDSGGIKKLKGFDSIMMPVIDEDDDLPVIIRKDEQAGGNASEDFMRAMNNLLQ